MKNKTIRITSGILKGALAEILKTSSLGTLTVKLLQNSGAYKKEDLVHIYKYDCEEAK